MVTPTKRSNDGLQPATLELPSGGRAAWPGRLAWTLWTLALVSLPLPFWLNHLLRRAGYPYPEQLEAYTVLAAVFVPAALSAATVGAVLGTRRPRNPVGWLLLGMGLAAVSSNWAPLYALYGQVARPGAVPAAGQVGQLLGNWMVLPACLGFVLLLTPTGSLPSPRWRWWASLLAAAVALYLVASLFWAETLLEGDAFATLGPQVPNPLHVAVLAVPLQAAADATFFVILLGLVVGAASLVVRFGHARGLERLQLRWVALAAVLTAVAALVYVAGLVLDNPAGYVGGPAGIVAVMPLLIGAAVLRYRLYDLDRIISRTIAYGLLTLLLGGGYALVVVGLGQRFGQGSPLVVAAATLAVAAVFQPARRRIQHLVDRRFNRRRYDTARTIEAFSTRLRQQLDVDRLTAELLAVVDQTMQPTTASLWLRPVTASQGAGAPSGPRSEGGVGVADDKAAPITDGSTKEARTQPAPEGDAV